MLAFALVLQSLVGAPSIAAPPPAPVIESRAWRNGAERLYKAKWNGQKWAPLTQTVGFSFGTSAVTVAIPQFDDMSGSLTLTEAAFYGTAAYHRRIYGENTQTPGENGYIDWGDHAPWGQVLKVRLPASAKIVVNDDGRNSAIRTSLDGYDGTTDFAGDSGVDSGTYFDISQGTSTIRVQNALHLSELIGTGTTTCNVTRDLFNEDSHYPGAQIVGWDLTAQMTSGSVVYSY
jgi:hypothetical protein